MTRLSPRALLAKSAQAALLSANPERAPRHVAVDAVDHADALLALLGQSAFSQDEARADTAPLSVDDQDNTDELLYQLRKGR
ncbi:hypothetical protein QOL99_00360 [Deinococcus sp. MIMF12]|uniref:Uncharacterized protein n=1 Tax=Deinococcus rhizophilus TaxID=3049544 RepID=A0ABT7JC35_9DEIO|nr:hypothetical protein [Deinococcus rhizophilus]MDL2342600.1 hypothetical protein [Deinococcus rhizophilus]